MNYTYIGILGYSAHCHLILAGGSPVNDCRTDVDFPKHHEGLPDLF